MIRRLIRVVTTWSALALGTCLAFTGCETLHHNVHPSASEEPATEAKPETGGNEPRDVQSPKQSFFKPSRLPGGMSDEGREIERDLGIP
jgi:hypothetical protein